MLDTVNNIFSWLSGYTASLVAGFTQIAILLFWAWLQRKVSTRRTRYGSGALSNRKIYIGFIFVSILLVFLAFIYFYFTSVTKLAVLIVTIITSSVALFVVVKELSIFWNFGFNYIEKSIARDTYKRAFHTVTNEFLLVGTSAFSYAELDDFEAMLKRVRENRGKVRLLLVHPDSNGLKEAAKNRGWREELYQCQARYSLGKIIVLQHKLAVDIQVKLYKAASMEDLPIFRAMFLDSLQCVAAVAVYGRIDHGQSSPQLFAQNSQDSDASHRTIYSVLYRYFRGLWDGASTVPTSEELDSFVEYWKKLYNDDNARLALKP